MASRRLLGGLILGLLLAGPLAAQTPTTVVIGTPPQPNWIQLSPQQKTILAPLLQEWDKMENIRRKKWLGIAERYPQMKPDEQQRMQDRMRDWAALTPEQRAKVRGTYRDFQQLPPEQKQAVKQKWEAYANLPAEERQKVRETGKSAKLLALPASSDSAIPASSDPQPATTVSQETSPPPISEAGKN